MNESANDEAAVDTSVVPGTAGGVVGIGTLLPDVAEGLTDMSELGSLESLVMVLMRRLEQWSASSRASIQHFPVIFPTDLHVKESNYQDHLVCLINSLSDILLFNFFFLNKAVAC